MQSKLAHKRDEMSSSSIYTADIIIANSGNVNIFEVKDTLVFLSKSNGIEKFSDKMEVKIITLN